MAKYYFRQKFQNSENQAEDDLSKYVRMTTSKSMIYTSHFELHQNRGKNAKKLQSDSHKMTK